MILFSLTVAQIRLRLGEWDFSSESEPNPYMEQKAVKKVLQSCPCLSWLFDAFCVSLSPVCLSIFPYACIGVLASAYQSIFARLCFWRSYLVV